VRDKYSCFLGGVQTSSVDHSASYCRYLFRFSQDKAGWCVKLDILYYLVPNWRICERCFISTRDFLRYLYCLVLCVWVFVVVSSCFCKTLKLNGSLVSMIVPFVNPREQPTPITDIQSELYSFVTTCNGFEIWNLEPVLKRQICCLKCRLLSVFETVAVGRHCMSM
jgi:hypothetical protein